ncbi:MAG: hypothetical protein IJ744_11435 [Lachnospiraceae bacterium]|nr:hypothetical protein [Lachnospiraceae bacterium]
MTMYEQMDALYQKVLGEMEERIALRKAKGLMPALGYTSNLDMICQATAEDISRIIRDYLPEGITDPAQFTPPYAVLSLEDLALNLFYYTYHGYGSEVMLDNHHILPGMFPTTEAVGGSAAQATNALAAVGCEALLHYSDGSPAVRKWMEKDEIKLVTKEGTLTTPADYYETQEPEQHWILQFMRGAKVQGKHFSYEIPLSNRLIVSENVINRLVLLRQEYLDYVRDHAKNITSQLISGYNAIRDPENLKDRTATIAANMRAYHEANPNGVRYLEGGHIVGEGLNDIAMVELLPVTDLMATNEEEIAIVLEHQGIPYDINDIESLIAALRTFRARHGFRLGMLIHSKDYAIYVGDEVPGDIREGMIYGHAMAAARATYGVPADVSMVKEMLKLPLSPVGVAYAELIERKREEYPDVILVPSRLIERPKFTVGLGDTFLGGLQMCFGI